MGVTFDKRQMDVLLLAIKQTGEKASRGAAAAMESEAKEIVELARSYSPYDEGKLEDAIGYERVRGERDDRGRFMRDSIQVFVDPTMPGSGGAETVGEYAYLMHEEMEPYGDINRGEKTRAKGPQAGGKFLERAVRDRAKQFYANVRKAVGKAFTR
jgi:hypothetical protein